MNIYLLSVQDINNHMSKYVRIPASWRSKNYAFEFLESINVVINEEIMEEIAYANFHTLTVDESTDISISKCLILYFKYRVSFEYKTAFGGIIQLKSCDASSIVTTIRDVAAAPQTPQLGGPRPTLGAQVSLKLLFWLRDYFQFSRLVYNRFKL